jgi:ribosomal protein L29
MLLAQRKEAIEDLDKKLRSAKTDLIAQNLTRHRAELAFLRIQNAKKLHSNPDERPARIEEMSC